MLCSARCVPGANPSLPILSLQIDAGSARVDAARIFRQRPALRMRSPARASSNDRGLETPLGPVRPKRIEAVGAFVRRTAKDRGGGSPLGRSFARGGLWCSWRYEPKAAALACPGQPRSLVASLPPSVARDVCTRTGANGKESRRCLVQVESCRRADSARPARARDARVQLAEAPAGPSRRNKNLVALRIDRSRRSLRRSLGRATRDLSARVRFGFF